jgi:peptidoglycan/xylan/chitin deacetylase (PgdA/CDA1 family)
MIIFTLHGVGKPSRPLLRAEADVWLSVESFEAILDELCGYDNFSLTVDDSNHSDIEIVMPAILERNMKAIYFIVVGNLDRPGYLSRTEVKNLVQAGMTVGSHGMHHKRWRKLNAGELDEEINVSKKILESVTGQKIKNAACPFGDYDHRVLSFLKKAGFEKVYTSDMGLAREGSWIQPRNTLRRTDGPSIVKNLMNKRFLRADILVRDVKIFFKRQR